MIDLDKIKYEVNRKYHDIRNNPSGYGRAIYILMSPAYYYELRNMPDIQMYLQFGLRTGAFIEINGAVVIDTPLIEGWKIVA